MANLRVIKKDVIYLVNEVISDCWLYMYFNENKNTENVQKIIEDTITLGENIFEQINHYPKDDAKNHFRALNRKFIENVDTLFQRLSDLTK